MSQIHARFAGMPLRAYLAGVAVCLSCPAVFAQPAAGAPQEELSRYLRTPHTMEDLVFEFDGRRNWTLSKVVFGIRDGRLMLAEFVSTTPTGLQAHIDDRLYVDMLIEDTSRLPEGVTVDFFGLSYQLRGFTFGRADDGTGYVDWVHLLAPDGKDKFSYFEKAPDGVGILPLQPPGSTAPPGAGRQGVRGGKICGCDLIHRFVCSGLFCTSTCRAVGADPCDCSGTGFCFVDFEVFRCQKRGCAGTCFFFPDIDRCGCVIF